MSLLNDALKRAKLEALQREAEGASDYGLPTPRDRRRKSAISNIVLIVGVVLLAGVGALLGWWLARAGSEAGSHAARPEAGLQAPADGVATPDVGLTVESAEPAPTAGSEPATDRAGQVGADESLTQRPSTQHVPGESDSLGRGAGSENPPANETVDRRPTAANDSSAQPSLTDGASFVRLLELDGVRLELQGIAFQGGRSVAIINDLMVGPDDMVAGFEVVGIEPERVQLQGRGLTFFLTLH